MSRMNNGGDPAWRYGAAAACESGSRTRRLAGYRYGRQIADDFLTQ